jgi:hypothetical protein
MSNTTVTSFTRYEFRTTGDIACAEGNEACVVGRSNLVAFRLYNQAPPPRHPPPRRRVRRRHRRRHRCHRHPRRSRPGLRRPPFLRRPCVRGSDVLQHGAHRAALPRGGPSIECMCALPTSLYLASRHGSPNLDYTFGPPPPLPAPAQQDGTRCKQTNSH